MAKGKAKEPPSAEQPDQAAADATNEAEQQIKGEAEAAAAPELAKQLEDDADAAGSQGEPDEQSEGFVTGE
jgi:hypothetical protein